ncbi:hypothetical protein GCK32_020403 [Trichostrongylus colubriformis]|uniref:Uncharacterized protein n=1 Tax=Trichostrongylus colubriformis TaxID=6319 RepID=A0AAN8IKV8_TRICO
MKNVKESYISGRLDFCTFPILIWETYLKTSKGSQGESGWGSEVGIEITIYQGCNTYFMKFHTDAFLRSKINPVPYFVFKKYFNYKYEFQIRDGFVTLWRNELVNKYQSSQQVRETLDNIQTQLNCCGAAGCSDYSVFGYYPGSCQCANNPAQVGCATFIWQILESHYIYVIIVAAVILLVEVTISHFSSSICSSQKTCIS